MNERQHLKSKVSAYWNKASCGTQVTQHKKFSAAYFDEIEQFRYTIEPEIFAFAQFTRFHGKKVLEVGVGAGTDFIQWVRAGAHAYGVDLTKEAVDHVHHRLRLHRLHAVDIQVADAENLPHQDNFFDCVYSWGVIHHSPDTEQCLREIIRVTKPGGTIKIMVYNRYSLFAFYQWLLHAVCKGKPFQSISTVLFKHQESSGTKAYTRVEIKKMIAQYPVRLLHLQTAASNHDLLYYKAKPFRFLARSVASLLGWHNVGWFMTIELEKMSN
jgi:ubiquinone/menaquinone biosynthesis C-methylase UbiE